jgi:hypothetical protein
MIDITSTLEVVVTGRTVSVAELLVTVPTELLTTTSKDAPLSAATVAGVV